MSTRIMIHDVLRATAKEFALRKEQIRSHDRSATIVYARHVGLYVSRTLTRQSYEKIGYYFGGLNHSTVMSAVEKIATLKEQNCDLSLEIDKIALSATAIAEAREGAQSCP